MTPREFQAKLKSVIPQIQKLAPILAVAAANELEAAIKTRVFLNGKDTSGKSRQYSEDPIYVNPLTYGLSQAPTSKIQKTKVKQNNAQLKAGKKQNITIYLSGGYKELRQKAGKKTDVMNYVFSGGTKDSIKVIKDENGAALAITEEKASKIMQGHTKKNGSPILQPSVAEIEMTEKFIKNTIQQKVKEMFNA